MKRLSLQTERLSELTADELLAVAGAGADELTGRLSCFLSLVEVLCTPTT